MSLLRQQNSGGGQLLDGYKSPVFSLFQEKNRQMALVVPSFCGENGFVQCACPCEQACMAGFQHNDYQR